MSLEKEFVLYPEALELKQLRFDELCYGWYDGEYKDIINYDRTRNSCGWLNDNSCSVPTYSQTFRWFREYPDWPIESWIQPYLSDEPRQHEAFYWRRGEKVSVGVFSTHSEAELNLLRKLIEIVKIKQ